MPTYEDILRNALITVSPLMEKGKRSGSSRWNLSRHSLGASMEVIFRIAHHVPDDKFLSLFDNLLERVSDEEGREFAGRFILFLKRITSMPEFTSYSRRLIKRIAMHQTSATVKRFAYREKYGFSPPAFIVMSPTMTCNLKCYGCYAGEYIKKNDLPRQVMERVIKECRDLGIYFIVISGGEPFFSKDILDMWAANPDIFFLVYTNGTLIDERMAGKLAKMGNAAPCISVEGYETETDVRRGPGTFRKITDAMNNLRRAGVPFGFSATALRSNSELISSSEFINFYTEKGCSFGWYFSYMPVGQTPDLSLMPTPEQRIERFRRIKELRRTKPIMLADFWCDGSLVGGCIAGGRRYIHINSDGNVEPCVFAHFAVDNIKNKTITEIMKSRFFSAIRSRQPFTKNHLRPCMIVDNPSVLREVVVEGKAFQTHLGADIVVTSLSQRIDEYAESYAAVADFVWAKQEARQAPVKESEKEKAGQTEGVIRKGREFVLGLKND